MGVVAMNYNLLKVGTLLVMRMIVPINKSPDLDYDYFLQFSSPLTSRSLCSGGGFSQSGSDAEKDERRVQARREELSPTIINCF